VRSSQILRTSYLRPLAAVVVLVGLYLTSLYSYNLFHGLVESFGIVVAAATFVVVWNARAYTSNNYVLCLGSALIFVAGVDLLHTLAYEGLDVFPDYDTDLPTQLWLVGRYLHVLALLVSPFLLRRPRRAHACLAGFGTLAAVFLVFVFARWFPSAYVDGEGLTTFKVVSEYVICLLLLVAVGLLWQRRAAFEKDVFVLLAAAIVATVFSELLFTVYSSPFGSANMVGHLFKLITFYLVYKAVVQTALVRPYALLFRELKQSEEALREDERQQREIADVLQEALLTTPERVPGVAFGHLYRPATVAGKVGGDFYDVFGLGQGSIGILIGDVSGHGLEAAAFISLARDTIKAFAFEGVGPEVALEKANSVTVRAGTIGRGRGHFLTAFYAVLDTESGELCYSAAGHPPGIIRRSDGSIETLDVTSPVIGVFPKAVYRHSCSRLEPGDLLVLYTDGLTECRAGEAEFFGEENVRRTLAGLTRPRPREVPQRLFAEAETFCRGRFADDVAILTLSRDPEPAAGDTTS